MDTSTLQSARIIPASDIMDEFAQNAGTPLIPTGPFYNIEIKLDTYAQAGATGITTKVLPLYLHFNDLTYDQFIGMESAINEFWAWDNKQLAPESIKVIIDLANDLDIQHPIILPLSVIEHKNDQAFAYRENPKSEARAMFIEGHNRVPVLSCGLNDIFAEASAGHVVYMSKDYPHEHYKVLSPAQASKQFKRTDGAALVFPRDGRTNICTFGAPSNTR